MPSLSELPSDLNRRKFIRSLVRLGFEINTKGGAGSHIKATWPPKQKFITLQDDFRKDVLYETLKDIKVVSGITWEDIKHNL